MEVLQEKRSYSTAGREQKGMFRDDLFRHLDGLVMAPIAYCLWKNGVTNYLLENKRASLEQLAEIFKANTGYLHVALRAMASQGWIEYAVRKGMVEVAINKESGRAFSLIPLYKDVVELLEFSQPHQQKDIKLEELNTMEKIFRSYIKYYGIDKRDAEHKSSLEYQFLKHIEGCLVGRIAVHLGMGGMFHNYFMEASFSADEYHEHPERFEVILDFLTYLGWFTKQNGHYAFNDKGLFFAKKATSYGVTVSYLPMFAHIGELLFGDANRLWNVDASLPERHVDREMNVWGSGGAHSSYFKKIDEIVIHLFNQPLEDQPKGIADMGCGNGAFLIHLYELIEKNTLRGRHLDEYPLFLIGADFNKTALKVTRSHLIQADIWAKVVWGDVSNPDQLQNDLLKNYGLELKDLLSVRTFLDHNRIWEEPRSVLNAPSSSTGAFAYRGRLLSPDEVERNLKDHFIKWAPHISTFGLIVIELHTLNPAIACKNLGKTAATAYDATHGFSDQYILELNSFLKVLEEAGLTSDERYFSKFPDSELATVSVNYVIGKGN